MTTLKSELLLLLTAAIWGFSFVAQRMGMEHLQPLLFNGYRFFLGALTLLPFIIFSKKEKLSFLNFKAGLIAGSILFIAALLQQIGIQYTTAGKAGFITGLYVILVPILGILKKHRTPKIIWLSALLAILGLYFISETDNVKVLLGDVFVFIGSIFWAVHVLVMSEVAKTKSIVSIAFFQFIIASILNLIFGFTLEDFSYYGIVQAAIPIFYGGVLSVGVAFTMQIFGQRNSHPSHAAIILSLEGVFAVLGGWLIQNEMMSVRVLIGCSIMFIAILLPNIKKISKSPS